MAHGDPAVSAVREESRIASIASHLTEDEASHSHETAFHEEQVAEAALLALGEALVWVKKAGRSYPFMRDVEIAVSERPIGEFQVGLQRYPENPEAEEYVIGFGHYVPGTHRRFIPETTYTSRAAAKAACERYHATGKWE